MADNTSVEATAMISLRNKMGDIEVNAENIMTILKFTMEVVELTTLKGEAQKVLCVKLIREVVVEAPIADEKEKFLLDMIDNGTVGNTIDLIVGASRGEIDINTVTQVGTNCCLAFMKRR
jgi:regulator of RNase E activity RraB